MRRLIRLTGLGILGTILIVGVGISGDTKKDKETGTKKTGIPQGWGALKLTKDQREKVVAISADYDRKISELQLKINDLKAQRRAEQVKVLTEAQRATLLKGLTGETKDSALPRPPKDAPVKDK